MQTFIKICPLMSTAESKVECTRECALSKPNPINHECAIVQLVQAIDNAADQIQNIYLYPPIEEKK